MIVGDLSSVPFTVLDDSTAKSMPLNVDFSRLLVPCLRFLRPSTFRLSKSRALKIERTDGSLVNLSTMLDTMLTSKYCSANVAAPTYIILSRLQSVLAVIKIFNTDLREEVDLMISNENMN